MFNSSIEGLFYKNTGLVRLSCLRTVRDILRPFQSDSARFLSYKYRTNIIHSAIFGPSIALAMDVVYHLLYFHTIALPLISSVVYFFLWISIRLSTISRVSQDRWKNLSSINAINVASIVPHFKTLKVIP